MTDQPTPPLHEQVRTLEADLVMCREQLAQESERAEKAEKMATSPGSPLVQQADTYRRILGHPAIYTHTGLHRGRPMCMSDQIIARLDELAEAESERDEWRDHAESYRLDVAAIRDALDAPEDADINQLIDVVHAPSTRSPSRWRRRTASRSLNPQQRTEPTQMPEWHEDMVAKP